MKLIIDIDEEDYENGHLCNFFSCYSKKLDEVIYSGTPFDSVIEDIKAEIHATAEMYEDGDCYLSVEWIDDIIDKHISGKEK